MPKNQIIDVINKAVLSLLYPLTSQEIYETIVREASRLADATYISIILEQKGELVRVYSTLPPDRWTRIRKRGYTQKAFNSQKAFITHAQSSPSFRSQIKDLGVRSNIFIPLSSRGKSMGVLVINSPKEIEFTAEELDTLELFGSIASLAIRKTQLYDEMKQALETRDLFISMAAHELRTPLTTITGYIQLLKNRIPQDKLPESRWMSELSWESQRLNLLVNELLEVNKIKSGEFRYTFKECHLVTVIERALATFRFTHPEREILFENRIIDHTDLVIGDFDKLLQAINNVIENAVKYSHSTTQVNITLEQKKSDFIIKIQDRGHGISEKDLEKIYEKYFRVSHSEVEGMGIGLFLVKSIISKHRGEVKITSKIGKGTRVDIILPMLSYE